MAFPRTSTLRQPGPAIPAGAPGAHPVSASVIGKILLISLIALIPAALLVMKLKTDRLSGDGPSYLDIAQAVASGEGFQEPHGMWPGHPTARRPPLWPLSLSVPLRISDGVDSLSVMYATELALHGATVFGACLLVWILSGNWWRVAAASIAVSLWPGAIPYLVAGLSEPCSTTALTLGTALLCARGRWFFAGVLVLALVPLARPNFLILPFWAAVILTILWARGRLNPEILGSPRRWIAAGVLFMIPFTAWLVRNYKATGAFPVILTKSGEDLYGTYNPLSASVGGPYFGRWIAPQAIPGEESIATMATRMTELELSRYYQAKGVRFIRQNWKSLPLLMAGRLAYAAMPQWPPFGATPTGDRYSRYFRPLEWICRWALYLAAAFLLWRGALGAASWFGVVLGSVALTTATTVLVYFGWERFLYQLTILCIVLVVARGGGRIVGRTP